MSEAQESLLSSKALVLIARKDWCEYAWKRVGKRLIKCLSRS